MGTKYINRNLEGSVICPRGMAEVYRGKGEIKRRRIKK